MWAKIAAVPVMRQRRLEVSAHGNDNSAVEGAGREEDARSLQIFTSRCGTVCSGYHVTRDANTPSRHTNTSSTHNWNTTRRIMFLMLDA